MSNNHGPAREALEDFFNEGLISEVLFEVKSGKEATVFCCAARRRSAQALTPHPSPDGRGESMLLAAKVYRSLESGSFRNDAIYQTGRVHLARNGRAKRAAENKSAFGRELQYHMWLEHEWETMRVLHDAGCDVLQPLARSGRAILMPYVGDESTPAPILNDVDLERAEVERLAERLLWNIERMLHHHRVHGDLSPFNVLYWNGRATIIDFPQAIDPRLNPAAQMLLARDVEHICAWARKRGANMNGPAITSDLWSRFIVGHLG